MRTAQKVRTGPGNSSSASPVTKTSAQPRWQSRDENVGFLLWDARRTVAREFEKLIIPHGVSLGTFWILRVLWDEDGVTQSQLIQRGRMKGPTIVAAVAQLERDGLVTRVNDPGDHRKRQIRLTPKGSDLREIILPISDEVSRRSLKGFTAAERTQFKDMLRRVRANMAVE